MAARLPGETTHFNEMLMEDPHSRPFREVLREMVRSDDQSRERFEEQLHSLFSGDSQQVRPVDNNNFREVAATIGWWAGDALAPVPRTRIVSCPNEFSMAPIYYSYNRCHHSIFRTLIANLTLSRMVRTARARIRESCHWCHSQERLAPR